ncbi:hypothetical protein [Micromonospora sp. SH-82]|uniref:hypothetical protein n=1 Tax=Micromonospora sp. SH-82 TaxID=3132938 RepID=UPI003EBBC161
MDYLNRDPLTEIRTYCDAAVVRNYVDVLDETSQQILALDPTVTDSLTTIRRTALDLARHQSIADAAAEGQGYGYHEETYRDRNNRLVESAFVNEGHQIFPYTWTGAGLHGQANIVSATAHYLYDSGRTMMQWREDQLRSLHARNRHPEKDAFADARNRGLASSERLLREATTANHQAFRQLSTAVRTASEGIQYLNATMAAQANNNYLPQGPGSGPGGPSMGYQGWNTGASAGQARGR